MPAPWLKSPQGARGRALAPRLLAVILALGCCAPGPLLAKPSLSRLVVERLPVAGDPHPALEINIGRSVAKRLYRRAERAWRKDFDEQRVRADLSKLINQPSTGWSSSQRDRYLELKKTGSKLRYAQLLLGAGNQLPESLNGLVAELGHLNDALRYGNENQIRHYAKKARKKLDGRAIRQELSAFQPVSREQFRHNLKRAVGTVAELTAKKILSSDEYHTVRKQLTIVEDVFFLAPKARRRPLGEDLFQLLERIRLSTGSTNDGLQRAFFQQGRSLESQRFAIPAEQARDIRSALHMLRGYLRNGLATR